MYLHKTAPEPPARNTTAKSPVPQTVKPSAPQASAPVPRSASALIAAAGLPPDKLSASIISFARFFSLPLKPELMAAMRRQTLAQPPATAETQTGAVKDTADAGTAARNREALSLAAAAAESKGIELHPRGLTAFAEAIDPDWQKRQDSGGHGQRGRRNKNRRQQEEENTTDKTGPITAAGLKQMALESAQQNPLLAILNRLPGKDGRRWIVLPFSFEEGGREFRVSLRILLEEDHAPNRAACMAAACMALDIAESGRQWLFTLESANSHTDSLIVDRLSENRLTVHLQPHIPPKAHTPLALELSALTGIPLTRISVKNRAESFPCELGRAGGLSLSVNESV